MTCLRPSGATLSLGEMIVRRSRSMLLGAMLALSAMLAFSTFASWHSVTIHDDRPEAGQIGIFHGHDQPQPGDVDTPMHIAAHGTGQWMPVAFDAAVPAIVTAVRTAWLLPGDLLLSGRAPPALLRPPRN